MSNPLRVTVCELNDAAVEFASDWKGLVEHVKTSGSQLVVLPEMPFTPWFGGPPQFDPVVWRQALRTHDTWMERLHELSPAVVASTRPVNAGKNRLNQGFVWDIKQGYRPAHHKYYLPEEEGFREATWFNQGAKEFLPIQIGKIKMGFLICTELWFMQQARDYGQQGIHLLITPRASGIYTEKWLVGGRAAGVISGAFSLSSNHFDPGGTFGGQGWVVSPDGQVLGLTSQNQPFITVEIDLDEAERAKQTYPRNVLD